MPRAAANELIASATTIVAVTEPEVLPWALGSSLLPPVAYVVGRRLATAFSRASGL